MARAETVKKLLGDRGVRPRHRLGQNFLIDRRVLQTTLAALDLSPDDVVLEIGPGVGTLTEALARRARRVLAVEIDTTLAEMLRETLALHQNVEVIQGDALTVDLAGILSARLPTGGRALLAANLPYYITTPLLFRVLDPPLPLRTLVVMVQKEVAERMVAPPGSKRYGVLSVMIQYRTQPRLVAVVKRESFWPVPGVDSAVVRLVPWGTPPVSAAPNAFFATVRAAFSQRRKTLANSLAAGLGLAKDKAEQACVAAGIDPGRRAETLNLEEFSKLALALFSTQTAVETGVMV